MGRVDGIPAKARDKPTYFSLTRHEGYVVVKEVAAILVREGREIIIEPAPHADAGVVRQFILGSALAVALIQRGRLVLHASAVAADGGAVAFIGASGFGKSTTAAAFHANGHQVIADDVLPIQIDGDCPLVFPGLPRLKLWPDAAAYTGNDQETLLELHPSLPKRGRSVADGFSHDPLPLRRIYVLADGEELAADPMPPQDAVMSLVLHSGPLPGLQQGEARAHFLKCAALAKKVQVRRLRRPRSLDALAGVLRLVAEDLTHV
ncbi:MAG TPA: serine kinase [Thermoanaerobaculia bacterium]